MRANRFGKAVTGLVVALFLGGSPGAFAKLTTATISGNWDDAIWDNGAPAASDDVVVDAGVTVTLTNATPALASFTSGGTLTFSNWNTSLTAVNVQLTGGTVTHSLIDTNAAPGVINRVYFICSNLTVDAAAQISVYAVGYRGAQYVAGVNTTGQGPAPGTGSGGTTPGAGHGGAGGGATATYGSYSDPETPGSGGGYCGTYNQWNYYHGGNGGGVVRIQATGVVTVNGVIRADGGYINNIPFAGRNSGGAGGSIYVTCSTFGGSGLVSVRGGNGGQYDFGGGGGRVAVVFEPAEQMKATPSAVQFNVDGGEGRNVYGTYAGGYGTLSVSDGMILPTSWTNNDAALYVTSWKLDCLNITSTNAVGCVVEIREPGGILEATNIVLRKAGLTFPKGWTVGVAENVSLSNSTLRLYAAATNGVAPAYGASLGVTGNVELAYNSWLFPHSENTNGGSVFITLSNLIVDAASGINADGLGFRGAGTVTNQNGFGPGKSFTVGNGCGGAGYGGAGANGQGGGAGSAYGTPSGPLFPGSGGANNNQGTASDTTGSGGGLIWLEAQGDVTLNGALRANGTHLVNPGGWRAGGGSGGGVSLTCRSLSGTGAISANGGWGRGSAGGGGGGRIALRVDSVAQSNAVAPAVTLDVNGGPGIYAAGTRGSVYVNDPALLGGSWPGGASLYGVNAFSVPSLTVTNGILSLAETGMMLTVAGDALVRNGSIVGNGITLAIGGNLLADTNATITLNGVADFLPNLTVGRDFSMTGATLRVYAAPTNGAAMPGYGASVSVTGAWTMANNAWVYPHSDATNGGSVFFQARNLSIAANCGFNANGLGFRGGVVGASSTNGWGPGRGTGIIVGGNGAGGAGYGGAGGVGYDLVGAGAMYGSSNAPTMPGSGGGTTSSGGNVPGGNGGGLVWIEVERSIYLDGALQANGQYYASNTSSRAGGGSGGGIYVVCKTIAGSGSLAANGGWSTYGGGGGGGGRIAVRHSISNFTGTATALSGPVSNNDGRCAAGGPGTVVWTYVQPEGALIMIR